MQQSRAFQRALAASDDRHPLTSECLEVTVLLGVRGQGRQQAGGGCRRMRKLLDPDRDDDPSGTTGAAVLELELESAVGAGQRANVRRVEVGDRLAETHGALLDLRADYMLKPTEGDGPEEPEEAPTANPKVEAAR